MITSLGEGGAEAVLYRLIVNDQINSHYVVSLLGPGKYGPMLEALGVGVHTLCISPGRPSPFAFIRLVRILRREKPKIVQTWMYHSDLLGGLAARVAGIRRVVWGIHATLLNPRESEKTTIWIVRLLAKFSWWLPTKVVACGRRAMIVHEELGYDIRRMCFIPNGYDLSDFQPGLDMPADLKVKPLADQSIPLIGTVARFDPLKDPLNLLDALAIMRNNGVDFRYVLVGAGFDSANAQVVEWVAQRGLTERVTLCGSRNDIPNIMNALDIHVLSSSSEAFPNVVAEAMACGTPCVVTDVGDSASIVGDTGWVVPPRDAKALAEMITKGIQEINSDDWQIRCDLARQHIARNFSIQKMVNEYNEIWSTVLEN